MIGPVEEMTEASTLQNVQLYREWVDHVGLGEKVETLQDTTLPAYVGPLAVDAAVSR